MPSIRFRTTPSWSITWVRNSWVGPGTGSRGVPSARLGLVVPGPRSWAAAAVAALPTARGLSSPSEQAAMATSDSASAYDAACTEPSRASAAIDGVGAER